MAEWTLAQYVVLGAFVAVVPIAMYWEPVWDWIEERRRRAARKRRSLKAPSDGDSNG